MMFQKQDPWPNILGFPKIVKAIHMIMNVFWYKTLKFCHECLKAAKLKNFIIFRKLFKIATFYMLGFKNILRISP